jgi:hypothetical protein
MLAFKPIKFPVNIEQTLPIGGVVVQFLSPLLEEDVAVSTNLLFLFSRQPRPVRGRASGVVLTQRCFSLYMVPRGRAPGFTLAALREAGAERDAMATSKRNIRVQHI